MDNSTMRLSGKQGSETRQPPHDRIADGFPRQRMVVLPGPVVRDALTRPITGDLVPTDIGQFPSAACHYVNREKGVPQAIIIYCVRGEGWANIAGNQITIREDDVLIVPPGQAHSYGAADSKPWTIYWCHVAGRHLQHLLKVLEITPQSPLLTISNSQALVPLFEEVMAAMELGYRHTSLAIASLTLSHLFGLLVSARRTGGGRIADLDERIESTIAFMKTSINGNIRMSELAAMAKLSPSHYAVVFKRKTGYSVLDFFIRLKMSEACRLLDMTTLPIKAIADRLGYEDPLYFSRAFHKVMAVPPREYRALHKG